MFLKKIKKYKWAISLILLIGVFSLVSRVSAQETLGDSTGMFIGWIISWLIKILGVILVLVVKGLVLIARYQHFIDSQAVELGWVMVRDLCNMFFVVILLIIAFGTILHLENYSYKKWLPKLVLMAVLINFSKTICGILIDVAQVVMLTFVNSFKDIAGANLIDILGITDILTMAKDADGTQFGSIVGAYFLGFVYMIIAIIVITTMMAMLAMRLVTIWIYVVLSPLAYLLSAFPGGQSWASRWWSEFTKALIVGPVIAFFLWLSLAALQTGNETIDQQIAADADISGEIGQIDSEYAAAGTKASTPGALIKFVVAIGMLIGGLKIAQEVGGEAGSMAGKGVAALGKGKALAFGAGAGIGAYVGRQLGDVRDRVSEKAGVNLNVREGFSKWRSAADKSRVDRKLRIRGATVEKAEKGKTWLGRKAALLSTGDVAYDNFSHYNFLRGGTKKYSARVGQEEKKITSLKSERAQFMKFGKEASDNQEKITEVRGESAELARKKQDNISVINQLKDKEKAGTITDEEKGDLEKRKQEIPKFESGIIKNDKILQTLTQRKVNTEKATELDTQIADSENRVKTNKEKIGKRSLIGFTEARIAAQAESETEQGKVIAHINNPEELFRLVEEGMRTGSQGLVAAASKKLARTGNYNELNENWDLGTGLDGMHQLAEKFKKEGGLSEQAARGLVAEIGDLAKGANHFEAFATMKMDAAGNWQEATPLEHESAVLAEKTKVQSQKLCRDLNRLGVGFYQSGKPHTDKNWVMSKSQIKLYASKDQQYADDLKKTGNPSQIYFIGSNPENLKTLRENGAAKVAQVIEDFIKNNPQGGIQDYQAAIESIDDLY